MDNSPLNKLSPELLNTIAGMALTHDGDVILSGYLKTPNAAALTQTCKKMREDYVRLFFYSNTFKHVTRKGGFLVEVSRLERAIGPSNVNTMGSIKVTLSVDCDDRASLIYMEIKEFCRGRKKTTGAECKLSIASFSVKIGARNSPVVCQFWVDRTDPLSSVLDAQLKYRTQLRQLLRTNTAAGRASFDLSDPLFKVHTMLGSTSQMFLGEF